MSAGESVVVFDNRSINADARTALSDLGGQVNYVVGTVTDLAAILHTVNYYQVDSIIHIPAVVGTRADRYPIEALHINVIGTANILEAARLQGLRRVVIVSSSAAMGDPADAVTARREDETVMPLKGVYPVSKLTAEMLTHTYREVHGIDAVAIRPRTVYGPVARTSPMPIKTIAEAVCRGEAVSYEHGADAQFDLTYVKDFARGLLQAFFASGRLPYYVYNVSYGANLSLASVVDAIRAARPAASIELGSGPWGSAVEGVRPGIEVTSSPAKPAQDNSRARSDFGYEPIWNLDRAIPDYLHWIETGIYGTLD
jgi:UDP-glucose 4-epimerase